MLKPLCSSDFRSECSLDMLEFLIAKRSSGEIFRHNVRDSVTLRHDNPDRAITFSAENVMALSGK